MCIPYNTKTTFVCDDRVLKEIECSAGVRNPRAFSSTEPATTPLSRVRGVVEGQSSISVRTCWRQPNRPSALQTFLGAKRFETNGHILRRQLQTLGWLKKLVDRISNVFSVDSALGLRARAVLKILYVTP